MVATVSMPRLAFQPNYDSWDPPDELLSLLDDKALRTRDRVELVWAFYSRDHNGPGPWASEIAAVLSICKSNVERCMTELVAEGRARKRNGKFSLVKGKYSHPSIVKFSD